MMRGERVVVVQAVSPREVSAALEPGNSRLVAPGRGVGRRAPQEQTRAQRRVGVFSLDGRNTLEQLLGQLVFAGSPAAKSVVAASSTVARLVPFAMASRARFSSASASVLLTGSVPLMTAASASIPTHTSGTSPHAAWHASSPSASHSASHEHFEPSAK